MKTEFLLNEGSESWLNRLKWYVEKNLNTSILVYMVFVMIGAFFAFPLSFITKTNALIGLILFPFAFFCDQKKRFNYFYLASLIFFELLAYVYHLRIFYFFTLAFFILFVTEIWVGKVNTLILFLLVFMSPIFQQVSVILGFPIRLQISELAGHMLTWTGMQIQVEGNMMILNGSSFAVDEACMGLSMLAISMLMGVMVIAQQYHVNNKKLTFMKVALFFMSVFLLNLLCNLLRIMVLVLFNIPPENVMHELVGILCFVVYVMVPIYFLGKWMMNRYGKSIIEESGGIRITYFGKSCIMILSILILLTGIHLNESRKQVTSSDVSATLRGFKAVNLKEGITKLTSEQVLVYVKPIPEFFTSEHTPLLCWQGSGYHFESIRVVTVHGQEIYVGHLVNQKSMLYTAWWYSNGKIQTINQLDWRFRMMKGENRFSLINATSDNEADLNTTLQLLLVEKQLKISSD